MDRRKVAPACVVAVALASAWGCSCPTRSAEPRSVIGAAAPVAPADPRLVTVGPDTRSSGSCPATAPVECVEGCCPPGTACAADGGCATPAQVACPADAPVACPPAPSCDGGGCVAFDGSGHALHGLVKTPAHFGAGRFGGGVRLSDIPNSSSSWVSDDAGCASVLLPAERWPLNGGAATFELWASTVGGNQLLLRYGPPGDELVFSIAFGSFYAQHGSTYAGTGPDSNQAWGFVAATVDPDAGTLRLFFNGQPTNVVPLTAAMLPSTRWPVATIGAPVGTPDVYACGFMGDVDELRVLNVALSPAQIAQDYAAGVLDAIPGTIGLWHFDDATGACCPAGTTCGAGPSCASAGGSSCPSSAPVSCDAGCCPAGTSCGALGCDVSANAAACPSSGQTLCPSGGCCDQGYTCLDGGCVQNPASPPTGLACPSGSVLVGAGRCCPENFATSTTSLCGSTQQCSINGCNPLTSYCGSGRACPVGYTCDGRSCVASSTPTLCGGGVACTGACCGANQTCTAKGCCPSGMVACGDGCCPSTQCTGTVTCNQAVGPESCPTGTTACGDVCCPSSGSCTAGECLSPTRPVSHVCISGTVCGDTCCGAGWDCLAPGLCGHLSRGTPCTAQIPNSCNVGYQPCCAPGFVCFGGGGHQGYLCVGSSSAHQTPKGHPCGDGGVCAAGDLCTSNGCCPGDHPFECGSQCCLPGGGCTGGQCSCPAGDVSCGELCCGDGASCVNGACMEACPAAQPTPCGERCCAPGFTLTDAGLSCPADHPVDCGDACCLPDGPCTLGSCACPPGRAECGAMCCASGDVCTNGSCGKPSSGGGGGGVCPGGRMFSMHFCYGGALSGCQCDEHSTNMCVTASQFQEAGLTLPDQCTPEGASTNCYDSVSGKLVAPCCPGLTCKLGSSCGITGGGSHCVP